MATKDLHNNMRTLRGFATMEILGAGTYNGPVTDISGGQSLGVMVVIDGFQGAGVLTYLLNESDDPTFTTSNVVAPEHILGTLDTLTTADENSLRTFGYIGIKRFIRFDYVLTGTATIAASAYYVQRWLHQAPPTL